MTPAEREFEIWKCGFNWADHNTSYVRMIARSAFLAGRAAGLRAALLEHNRPLVAHQVADGVMRSWDEAAVPEGCDA